MKVGIFGGSFNPIHNAHIALARTICRQMALDEVWFLISPHNPLKESSTLLGEEARLDMARLALEEYPELIASDYEFGLERPSFTWNTLTHLRRDYPEHQFSLIIGGDNWDVFPQWSHHEDIIRSFRIIVYPREGSHIDTATLPGSVTLADTPEINITSTMIRQMIREGRDISQYVPAAVMKKIREEGYYL